MDFFNKLFSNAIKDIKSATQVSIGGSNISQVSGKGGTSIQTSNGLTVVNKNGNIEIKGEIKSLKINGKEVSINGL